MADRTRARRGTHASIAGAPADETLDDLVAQFSDRYAFARELIQNSLDAGAARIELDLSWSDGTLSLAFVDDGEGMDRATIEGYLLTLFRSTKERDLTKIGKFGIGFVSLFAMQPEQVVVETGRDLVAHRVTFAADRSWVLEELDDLLEGTTVTLVLPCSRDDGATMVRKVIASAHRWCRFARAELVYRVRGLPDACDDTAIVGAFEVDAPLTVSFEQDGLRAVLGPSADDKPRVGFFSGGLTSWEGRMAALPGVTFLVEGRHLGHTLTRDNVRRDTAFEEVIERLEAVASRRLRAAVEEALLQASSAGDDGRLAELLGSCRVDSTIGWSDGLAWVPAWPEPVTLGHVRRRLAKPLISWFGRREPMVCSEEGGPLVDALAASHLVLRTAADGALARFVAELTGAEAEAADGWVLTTVRSPTEAEARQLEAAERLVGRSLRVGSIYGRGQERLAVAGPAGLRRHVEEGDEVVVSEAHPLWAQLLALPPTVAGPLLAHAVACELGTHRPVSTDHVRAAVAGWEGR